MLRALRFAGQAVLLLLLLAAWSAPARAGPCLPWAEMAARLSAQHQQARAGVGVAAGGREAVELWARPDGGTWTVLLTRADGFACVLRDGKDWLPASPLWGAPS